MDKGGLDTIMRIKDMEPRNEVKMIINKNVRKFWINRRTIQDKLQKKSKNGETDKREHGQQ